MTDLRFYVPGDSAARSVGADETARAIAAEAQRRGTTVDLVRNGSRGMLWLEPLVEVATPAGRVAYGPVAPEDVAGIFDEEPMCMLTTVRVSSQAAKNGSQ